MAANTFDLLTAIKIIPQFNGDVRELENFLKIIDLYHETINEEGKAKLIDFIWCARLTPKTKTRLAAKAKPNNLAELKNNIQSTFKLTKTTHEIQGQISNLKQNNKSVKDYVDKLSLLIADLNTLQITEIGADNRETICKLNDKLALTIFQNGIKNELKPTIFAAQCKTFSEAATLAEQIENPINGEQKILHFSTYNKNKFKNSNNRYTYGTNNNRNNTNSNGNGTNNYRVNNNFSRRFDQYKDHNNYNRYNSNNKYSKNNNNGTYQYQRVNRNANFRRDQSNNFSPGMRRY